MPRTKMKRFTDGRGREVWFNPDDADGVKHIPTRYGPRLLLYLRDSGAEFWLEDNPDNRKALKLEQAA